MELGRKFVDQEDLAQPNSNDQEIHNMGENDAAGDKVSDEGENRVSMKKKRKIKKFILVEKEDFWSGLDSDREEAVTPGRNTRKSKVKKRKAKLSKERRKRMYASLDSVDSVQSGANFPIWGNSLTDSVIETRNRVIEIQELREEAEQMWILGKELGSVAKSNEEAIIDRLVEMEIRDRNSEKGKDCGRSDHGVQNVC